MKKASNPDDDIPMRDEYDFTGAVRGKYYERYMRGRNLVELDPDVAKVFPDSKSVNEALRKLAAQG